MLTFVRAGLAAALVVLLPVLLLPLLLAQPAAAEKAFQRDDLADAAIKLEAKIKSEAGAVTKTAATLRRDADAAFARNDLRNGLQQLAAPCQIGPAEPLEQRSGAFCAARSGHHGGLHRVSAQQQCGRGGRKPAGDGARLRGPQHVAAIA
jgi:hypothetical protein